MGGVNLMSRRSVPAIRRRSFLGSAVLLPAFACRSVKAAADFAFTPVTSPKELDAAVSQARARRKPVLVYVTAEWCPICKGIDNQVFSHPVIRGRLERIVLVRVDVTEADEASRALMGRLDVPGPPTLLVLAARTGQEIPRTRLIGRVSANLFLDTINLAGL